MPTYMSGRDNLAVTLFVPWDCGRNCPFCTTKHEYKNTSKFSLDKQISTLLGIWCLPDIKDVVITGGEPLENIPELDRLFGAIHSLCRLAPKKVFINTSKVDFTKKEFDEFQRFLDRYRGVIDGVSISNHIGNEWFTPGSEVISSFRQHKIPVRMNCVVDHNAVTHRELIDFVLTWQHEVDTISFRRDYTTVYDEIDLTGADAMVYKLVDLFGQYTKSGCLVCHDNVFKDGKVHYHRGYKNTSSVNQFGDVAVNDLIIKQDGKLYLDWEGAGPFSVSDVLDCWETVQPYPRSHKKAIQDTQEHKSPVGSIYLPYGLSSTSISTCGDHSCGAAAMRGGGRC